MQLDVNRVIDKLTQRLSDTERELVLLQVQNEQLQEELENKEAKETEDK